MKISHCFKLEDMPVQVLSSIQNGYEPRYQTIYADVDYDMFIEIPDEEVYKALEEEGVVYSSEDDLVDLYYNYLEDYFEDLDIDVKRLRNSYMHGRYHYNHNMGFNFYDGLDNDNLKYIGSLHVNDMLKVISNFMAFNRENIFEITK